MHTLLIISATAVFVGLQEVHAQTLNIGACPVVTVKKDFDVTQYTGTWYENRKNRRYYNVVDPGLKCTTETYQIEEGGGIRMTNRGTRVTLGRAYLSESLGRLTAPGKMIFSSEDSSVSPRWILDTDYKNYAVAFSCIELAGMNTQVAWILTREPDPEPQVIRKAFHVLDINGISRSSMTPTLQSNCKYLRL